MIEAGQIGTDPEDAEPKKYQDTNVSIAIHAGVSGKDGKAGRVTKHLSDEWIRGTRAIRFIMYAVLIYSIAAGVRNACLQHVRLENCTAIRAEVVTSSVELHKAEDKLGKSGYVPKVRFKYTVNGRTYASEWLTSMNAALTQPRENAMEFVARYPPGKEVRVYYLPDKPDIAFLLRSYVDFWYCAGVVIFSIVLCFFFWLCMGNDYEDKYRFWKCLVLCVYWIIVGIFCYGYYFHHAERQYSLGVIISCGIYFFLGLFWILQLFYSKFHLLPRGLRWKNR
jgi:hypothetical protein